MLQQGLGLFQSLCVTVLETAGHAVDDKEQLADSARFGKAVHTNAQLIQKLFTGNYQPFNACSSTCSA
jgi:hypothetical protein